jgi:hypothetical protein
MGSGIFGELGHADALLRLAQSGEAASQPSAYQPASWVSYSGGEAILLAIALLLVAGGFAYAGKRLRAPLRVAMPGGVAAAFMIAIWLLSLYDVIAATFAYGLQVEQAYPTSLRPA